MAANRSPNSLRPDLLSGGGTEIWGHWSEYLAESSRPLVSLVFVAPILVAYEGGLLLYGPWAMRNGADIWLRRFLEGLGFSQYFLLPLLTCGILLSWHHLKRERWNVDWSTLYGMWFESVVFGAVLLVGAYGQDRVWSTGGMGTILAWTGPANDICKLSAFLGAGIYEELLFRLILLPLVFALIQWAGATRKTSLSGAILISALLFAAAHYRFEISITGYPVSLAAGEEFNWTSFSFRALAGVFFSVVYWYRGFGVAAGTHALYDILVAEW